VFLSEDRMTEFQLQLQRRREHARRTFEHLAAEARRQGAENLAGRLNRLGWNVGARMRTSTPPALADKLKARLPKLIAAALADPTKSFYELAPIRRRKMRATVTPEQKKGTRR